MPCSVATAGPSRRRDWTASTSSPFKTGIGIGRHIYPRGRQRPPACNPFGPKGVKLEGLPFTKSLVIVAGLDLVQDWQLAYADGLKKAGHFVKLVYREQATIGFYLLPNTNHFYQVMEEIKNFVGSNLL
ncbi:gibberellin receptor [Musa troglodytarum]|uniref:Gibberellin receptor n=1 Tax=Musa troglodytarum TaxID=320322 RepID=A0A9E7JBP7_9LILI|nr:gibberellin receptor [Musa troglodytarum]